MSLVAGVTGHAPSVLIKPAPPKGDKEQDKYRRMWAFPQYRQVAPGEHTAFQFLRQVKPNPGDTLIDFGAGTGRGALMLALMGRVNVTMVDFADNCLDPEVRDCLASQAHALRFVEADLRQPLALGAKYGFCTDVMEHIEPEQVDAVLQNILKAAQHVFFQISLVEDALGALIGEPLHLTVQSYAWWLDKFRQHDAVLHWSHSSDGAACFYVTAWNTAEDLVARGGLNTERETLNRQIRSAVSRSLRQVRPHDRQETPVMILGGGPSLTQFEQEIIRRRQEEGMVLVTTNGTYNWAVERGLKPSAQIIVDAREFNSRFVFPVVEGCKYLIASQCHPAVFEALPPEQTWVWHSGLDEELCEEMTTLCGAAGWFPIPGGSTVMLRALPLLRLLGFHRFEAYGFDSCLEEGRHHAYAQAENDNDMVIRISCGGRVFFGHPWMASQAEEFIDLVKFLGDEIDLIVHGDGLISHIISTAATLEDLRSQDDAGSLT